MFHSLTLHVVKVSSLTLAIALVLVALPFFANAQILAEDNELTGALGAIVNFINGVLIPFLFAIGFFMFVWGVIKFFVIGGNNDEAKAEGKSLIIYALAGFVVILIFWGIVNIFAGGILADRENVQIQTPNAPLPGGGAAATPTQNGQGQGGGIVQGT